MLFNLNIVYALVIYLSSNFTMQIFIAERAQHEFYCLENCQQNNFAVQTNKHLIVDFRMPWRSMWSEYLM